MAKGVGNGTVGRTWVLVGVRWVWSRNPLSYRMAADMWAQGYMLTNVLVRQMIRAHGCMATSASRGAPVEASPPAPAINGEQGVSVPARARNSVDGGRVLCLCTVTDGIWHGRTWPSHHHQWPEHIPGIVMCRC
jgi:hypothetical protein